MRKEITVTARVRPSRGKNEARRLRASGFIPAVVYGAYKDSVPIGVSPKEVTRILHSTRGHNTIFNLAIDGVESAPVMIVDVQLDPVRGHLLHADFKRIDLSKRIRVNVSVVTKGEPKGVKQQGGLLEIVNREIEIECLPDDIPEQFVVDVSELLIGQSVRAGSVELTGLMKLTSAPDAVIAHCVALRAEVEAPAAAAEPAAAGEAAPAEPEVIKKGKKEEEVEAPPAETKGKKK